MTKKKNYEVGYKKPPKEHQFKPNQSGNPKGRPKGSKNFRTDVKDTLNEKVAVSGRGRKKKVSTQKAALLRLREKALNGDSPALDRYIELARIYNDDDTSGSADVPLSASDEAILASYLERGNRRSPEVNKSDETDKSDEADETEDPTDDNVDDEEDDDDDAWLH